MASGKKYITASNLKHNPRGAPSSVPGIIDPGFEDSSGYPSVISINDPIRDPSPGPVTKSPSVTSETPTKYLSCMPKKVPSANPSNIII